MYTLYGIPNCDTVKKARVFLEKKGLSINFVDFKKSPPQKNDIERWAKAFGGLPVNTKGTTYKKHSAAYEALGAKEQLAFILANSSMIKRPILEKDGEVLNFGFDESVYKALK